jgi:predicted enzyme related to lactoylglutathione lyase
MTSSFRYVQLFVKDVSSSVSFYHKGLGLSIVGLNDHWAELAANVNTPQGSSLKIPCLAIKKVDSDAVSRAGYSPFLCFDVMDLNSTVGSLISLGGELDGPIKHPVFGKFAVIRSPDGHMIGLYEEADFEAQAKEIKQSNK